MNAVLVTCSASGSSSGLAGSLGQIVESGWRPAAPWRSSGSRPSRTGPCGSAGPGRPPATDGSAASWAACAGVTVAEKALIDVNPCTLRAPIDVACEISGAWSVWLAEIRAEDALPFTIDRFVCWLRSSTMTPDAFCELLTVAAGAAFAWGEARAAAEPTLAATTPTEIARAISPRLDTFDNVDPLSTYTHRDVPGGMVRHNPEHLLRRNQRQEMRGRFASLEYARTIR